MKLFSKKNKKIKQLEEQGEKIIIHTLPQKFLKKKRSNISSGNGMNILIFIIIFLLVGSGIFFIFKDYIFPQGLFSILSKTNIKKINNNNEPFLNINKINNINSKIINTNTNTNTNTLSNININRNRNININKNDNNNNNNNNNTNNTNNLSRYIQVIPSAPDRDHDTMPDIEESLYGTNPGIADTDKDGFLDGQEVANAYNPLKKGSNKLFDSKLVKVYNNPTYKYSVLYPTSWKVIPLGGGDQEITFISNNKEFIEIAVIDNPEALTAVDWYLNQIPSELTAKAERFWANKFLGIKSLDGLDVYFTPISGNNNFIYQISYMVGSHTHINFPVTFQMMIRTFDSHQ